MNTPTIKVTQSPDNPVAVEVLAESIVAISSGIKKLLGGPLSEDTLVLLIQHAAPTLKTGTYGVKAKVGQREIKAVLRGIEQLARVHLKAKK